MPTRPTSPDPSGTNASSHPFANLGTGLDFFQDWIKAAGSALPNLQGTSSQAGAMPAWSMPTLDPQELDKRIQDLRTVQFWLEQNARMIAMTIQGLEVQKMTLSTLQGMNVSMDAVRDALRARSGASSAQSTAQGSDAAPATPPATPPAEPPPASPAPASPEPDAASQADLINPMRWWDTLTQQFTHLASQTAQTAQSMSEKMGEKMGESLQQGRRAPARKASAARKPASKAAARPRAKKPSGSDAA